VANVLSRLACTLWPGDILFVPIKVTERRGRSGGLLVARAITD
jgi:hypothetical protein